MSEAEPRAIAHSAGPPFPYRPAIPPVLPVLPVLPDVPALVAQPLPWWLAGLLSTRADHALLLVAVMLMIVVH
jgi:hypothetical protein